MSLIPYLFDYNRPRWPSSLLDQDFGLTLTPEDLSFSPVSPLVSRIKPWWPYEDSSIKIDKNNWQINIDVLQFSPDEITVKTADGYILVEGKHEEKEDEHGFISRQFLRRFKLPEGVNPDLIQSKLSSDGVLTVTIPNKDNAIEGGRNVPIIPTGPARKELVDEEKDIN